MPARFPADLRRALNSNESGIGRAIQKAATETPREILRLGIEEHAQVADALRAHYPCGCLVRSYRIIMNRRPVMLIHERFPP